MENFVGKQFGKLKAIERIPRYLDGKTYYKCKCECGNISYVYTSKLKRGDVISCGCSRRKPKHQNRKEFGESSKNKVISYYRFSAQRRNLEFSLSREDCLKFFSSDCHYCGCRPSRTVDYKKLYGTFTYNGIDRKDNSIGYTLKNCVSCCSECNYRKKDCNYKDFINWINKVYQNTREILNDNKTQS